MSEARIGDPAPLCNAQNCRCCDAPRGFLSGIAGRIGVKTGYAGAAGIEQLF
jgi:hypothetical protein